MRCSFFHCWKLVKTVGQDAVLAASWTSRWDLRKCMLEVAIHLDTQEKTHSQVVIYLCNKYIYIKPILQYIVIGLFFRWFATVLSETFRVSRKSRTRLVQLFRPAKLWPLHRCSFWGPKLGFQPDAIQRNIRSIQSIRIFYIYIYDHNQLFHDVICFSWNVDI